MSETMVIVMGIEVDNKIFGADFSQPKRKKQPPTYQDRVRFTCTRAKAFQHLST